MKYTKRYFRNQLNITDVCILKKYTHKPPNVKRNGAHLYISDRDTVLERFKVYVTEIIALMLKSLKSCEL
jgi:hypothetical protein